MYTSGEHIIAKGFINLGVKFVQEFQTGLSQPSDGGATIDTSVSDIQFTTPVEKIEKLGAEVKIEKPKMNSKKKKKNKGNGKRRLLKFQEKLVKFSGLPPSRLMRSLAEEFEQVCVTEASPHNHEKEGGEEKARQSKGEFNVGCQKEVTETGVSSRYFYQPSLCSSPPLSFVSPVPNVAQPHPSVLNAPPLPSQPVLDAPPPPPYNHQPLTQVLMYPAYCWHCNLWGNVYTSPVY